MGLRAIAAWMAAALVVTGCSFLELSTEQQEDAYLLRVAQAESHWLEASDRFDRALGASYSTRGVFLVAISDAGLAEGAKRSLDAADALTPPETLAVDHEHWLVFRRAIVELEPQLVAAIQAGDTLGVIAARQAFGEVEGDFLLSIGRQFCVHLNAVDPAEDCPADQNLVGGEYGQAVFGALREYAIRTGPLFFTGVELSPTQRASYLDRVQPDIEQLLRNTGDRLRELAPPNEFAGDHDALLAYFDDQHATAVAITAANATGDDARVLELYEQYRAATDRLQGALSEAGRSIVDPAF